LNDHTHFDKNQKVDHNPFDVDQKVGKEIRCRAGVLAPSIIYRGLLANTPLRNATNVSTKA